jgi:hypothetical protein
LKFFSSQLLQLTVLLLQELRFVYDGELLLVARTY